MNPDVLIVVGVFALVAVLVGGWSMLRAAWDWVLSPMERLAGELREAGAEVEIRGESLHVVSAGTYRGSVTIWRSDQTGTLHLFYMGVVESVDDERAVEHVLVLVGVE